MRRVHFKIIGPFVGFLLLSGIAQTPAQERVEAWAPSGSIQRFQEHVSISPVLNDALPVPSLMPEPRYTIGSTNVLYWDRTKIMQNLDQYNVQAGQAFSIVFYEITAVYGGVELWGFIDAGEDHAVFTGLPNDSIEYALRYYAYNETSGEYGVSGWSSRVYSIQDSNTPILDAASCFQGIEKNGGHWWIIGSELVIHIVASDAPPGKIKAIHILETGEQGQRSSVDSTFVPTHDLEWNSPYIVQTGARQPVDLTVYVEDWSGQRSESMSVTLYWWPPEDGKDRVVCFPNPFRPEEGELSTIKVDLDGVTEARVLDHFGNLVRILEKPASNVFFKWDGRNGRGEMVSRGGYIVVLKGYEKYYCKIAIIR